jgi:hypothetical protein
MAFRDTGVIERSAAEGAALIATDQADDSIELA